MKTCDNCGHNVFGVRMETETQGLLIDGKWSLSETVWNFQETTVANVWCRRCGKPVEPEELPGVKELYERQRGEST